MATGVRMSRSRGSLSGLILILLGAWGGLAPLLSPYLKLGFTPDQAWFYSTGRLYLVLLPGGVAVLAGLVILVSRSRWLGGFCAILAALAGAWFLGGQAALLLLTGTTYSEGITGSLHEQLKTNFECVLGVGALIIFFAALSLGRQSISAYKDFLKFGDQSEVASGGLANVGLGPVAQGFDSYAPPAFEPATYATPDPPVQENTSFGGVSYEPVTSQHPIVGGGSQFPSQYPETADQYSPGAITYSPGQTQFPQPQFPPTQEQTNPVTRPAQGQ
jgi:hypothetical protein